MEKRRKSRKEWKQEARYWAKQSQSRHRWKGIALESEQTRTSLTKIVESAHAQLGDSGAAGLTLGERVAHVVGEREALAAILDESGIARKPLLARVEELAASSSQGRAHLRELNRWLDEYGAPDGVTIAARVLALVTRLDAMILDRDLGR